MGNTLVFSGDVFVLQELHLVQLKELASRHELKRSRLCLHSSRGAPVQEMIIVVHRDSYLKPHKHPPGKPESYHVIEGELAVNLFTGDGVLYDRIVLRHNGFPRMYRICGDVWHQPVPLSEWVVYHEVYTGPFEKDSDVIYCTW